MNIAAITERAKALLLKPKDEWTAISDETASMADVLKGYALPLIAIGPLCSFLGGQVFGIGAFGFGYHPSLLSGLSVAISTFVFALLGLFVLTFVASKLAAQFGGQDNMREAFRLVAYSMTAAWIAGVFGLVPALAILGIVGLYSFYLFYVGVAPMLRVPGDKALSFTVVTVICAIVLNVAIGALAVSAGRLSGGGLMGRMASSSSRGDTLSLPGGAKIDVGKMEQAANDMEAAMQRGAEGAAAPAALQALLPDAIGGYRRVAVESVAAGPTGTRAEATYENGDRRFNLSILDMAAMSAIAGLGVAVGVEENREDADGYERTTTRGGVLVKERWSKSAGEGAFGTMIGKRFMVEAEGRADSIDELKAAVAAGDTRKLAALAK